MEPAALLEQLLEEGVTQVQLANQIGCTRQAVGVLAARHGFEFPGAKVDLDDVVRQVSGHDSFQSYIDTFWGDMTQAEMAEQLGISLSTMKRRCKEISKPAHIKRGRPVGKSK
jgi:DNA-binding XRE family transcriptional regulator